MALKSLGTSVVGIFAEFGRAQKATTEYSRLANMSDAALAKQGLERGDIARHVFKTVFDQ